MSRGRRRAAGNRVSSSLSDLPSLSTDMIRSRFSTAFALLLAPCLALGCADDDTVEPSVGGTTPETMDADGDMDATMDGDMDYDATTTDDDTTMTGDGEERPSNELDDQD